MLKLIIGVKGTGKTKSLINLVNTASAESKGDVVCIEKGVKLRYDVKSSVRLINTEEYFVADTDALYGFIAGILASNHDITDIFVDSALKICNNHAIAFDGFVELVAKLAEKNGVNIVMTSSIPADEASDIVKKYL
jgi:Tfp pilus assembly ATPase PilU